MTKTSFIEKKSDRQNGKRGTKEETEMKDRLPRESWDEKFFEEYYVILRQAQKIAFKKVCCKDP